MQPSDIKVAASQTGPEAVVIEIPNLAVVWSIMLRGDSTFITIRTAAH